MSSSTSAVPQRRTSWIVTALSVILGLILMGFVMFGVVVSFGMIQGEEFSPDTFQSRSYTYYQLPLLGVQISPVFYNSISHSLSVDLIADGLIVPTKSNQPRWHLARRMSGAKLVFRGSADIMDKYLEMRDDTYSLVWAEWTDRHPETAKILWPVVGDLAQDEKYMFLPELFEIAWDARRPSQFKRDVDAYLADQYTSLGAAQSALGEQPEAIESYTQALKYDPARIEALQGRAAAHRAAGDQEQAAADEAAADALTRDAAP